MDNIDPALDDPARGDVVPAAGEPPPAGPGQLYDAAMRRWAEPNLPVVARWLDRSLGALEPGAFVKRSASFTVPQIHADLLVTAGKGRLLHVEYETRPGSDLVARMYNYRGRIMTLYPRMLLKQYVIVLGSGTVTGYNDAKNGFTLDLNVIYLRQCDPREFLADPVLAPLAVLARGGPARREGSYGAALRVIRDSDHPRAGELLQIAETLATIRLEAATIERIGKENGMSIQPFVEFYRDTEVGLHLQALGRQKGRQEGREEGREGLLLALLRARFGDRPDQEAIVERLSGWSDLAAVEAISAAMNAQELLTAQPPASQAAEGVS